MNVLYLYSSFQTYTSTVYEHISSFTKYSSHNSFFAHLGRNDRLPVNLSQFDAVVIHYTIRLSFDQIATHNVTPLIEYGGLKAVFLQDEYDRTHHVWAWIKRLGVRLVFTVVPSESIEQVYPTREFEGVNFVSVLTGYVPEELPAESGILPSHRQLIVGYRGRHLPVRYGELGREKVSVGENVKRYCEEKGIPNDIEWSEAARIYGKAWYEFIASCRSILGSESGSNVFDWDGSLQYEIDNYVKQNPGVSEGEIRQNLIRPLEISGLMNQVSPKIFEAIALNTILVLYDGKYSGVIEPGKHFIPLEKDLSNIDEVFELLSDSTYVETMAHRAYTDIIASGKYSYKSFVKLVDQEIVRAVSGCMQSGDVGHEDINVRSLNDNLKLVTRVPVRGKPMGEAGIIRRIASFIWMQIPQDIRAKIKPFLLRLTG